jgi:hypothetical protein
MTGSAKQSSAPGKSWIASSQELLAMTGLAIPIQPEGIAIEAQHGEGRHGIVSPARPADPSLALCRAVWNSTAEAMGKGCGKSRLDNTRGSPDYLCAN